MSAAGRVNQKWLPPHKNNGINSLDRNEAESSHHGRSLSQYAYVADQTPERRQQRNDSSRHASVRFKLPAQATNSRVLSATTSRQIPPLSDAGGDFERVQPESSGNSSSSHLSRNPIQHEEIKRLQMEIAALKEVSPPSSGTPEHTGLNFTSKKSDSYWRSRWVLAKL